MKLPSGVPAVSSTCQTVQFNLHRTLYIIAEFSSLIIDETVYAQIIPSRTVLRVFNLTFKINPPHEP